MRMRGMDAVGHPLCPGTVQRVADRPGRGTWLAKASRIRTYAEGTTVADFSQPTGGAVEIPTGGAVDIEPGQ